MHSNAMLVGHVRCGTDVSTKYRYIRMTNFPIEAVATGNQPERCDDGDEISPARMAGWG